MTCAVEGCPKPAHTRGWCRAHYERWRRNGVPGPAGDARQRPIRACSIEGCEKRAKSRGWCDKHYQRWRVYGDPEKMVRPTYGQGRRVNDQGYVLVWAPGHPQAMDYGYALEHRKVAHDTFGPIPPGHQVHHLNHDRTDNRPENLEVKPAAEHAHDHAVERGTITNQFGTWPLRAA